MSKLVKQNSILKQLEQKHKNLEKLDRNKKTQMNREKQV